MITISPMPLGFHSIWVSTDNNEIAKEALKYNANVHWREFSTATDSAPSILGVIDFLNNNPEVDALSLIQCTSPLLKVKYLEEAFKMISSGDAESVFSVTRQFKLRWKTEQNGELVPDNFDPGDRPRRQDWDGELVENGMFYFTLGKLVKKYRTLQGGRLNFIEIPAHDSLEIDDYHDLAVAKALLEKSN